MATYTGMFGLGLDDQEERMRVADERNRNYAMQLARMSPDEAVSYQGIRGVQQAADGLGGALRGMTGSPNASERMAAARQEIEERLRGMDMKDPLVAYPVIIEVLQKYGFVEEAMKASKEYQELKLKADEQKRKTDKDAVSAEFVRAKAAALKGNDFNEMVKAYQDIQEQLASNPELSADQRMALQNMIRAYEVKLGIQRRADGTKFIPPSKYGKGGVFDPRTGIFTPVDEAEANRPEAKGSTDGKGWRDMGYEYNAEETKKRKVLENVITGERKYGEWQPAGFGVTEYGRKADMGLELIERLAQTFNKNYVGGMFKWMPEFASDLVMNLQRRGVIKGDQDALLWWQNYDDWYNRMLNMLSGAAVTANEAKRFEKTIITRGMDPDLAQRRLQEQINIAAAGARKIRNQGSTPSEPAPKADKPKPTQRFNPQTGKLEKI